MRRGYWVVGCAIVVMVMGAGRYTSAMVAGSTSQEHRDERPRFNDHDRKVVLDWYGGHSRNLPVGLRERDLLPRDLELRFEVGLVLDQPFRDRIHTVPSDLVRVLPVVPRGYRYVFIGGHLCLIDQRYEVVDIIHLGHER